tara:strand:+ start:4701 stop:5372 length:672 start_codon:yes stop_codon:yes gene_type:complete
MYGGTILKEFEEEVSGTSLNRVIFEQVVDLCAGTGSILLVHKLSRLSRNGLSTIAYLQKRKVRYIEAVSPGDSEFVKGIKLLQAKEENDERKGNIKSGLDQIKRNIEENGFHISKAGNRITSLGNPQNLSRDGVKKSAEVRKKKAMDNPNNKRAIAMLELLLLQKISLQKMADHLNSTGFITSQGSTFSPTAVSNLLHLFGKTRKPLPPNRFKKKIQTLKEEE